jgi:single-stranded DNA-binding protein
MAEITVKGYCNKPEAKTSRGGSQYGTFTLSERQNNAKKGEEPQYTRNFYNVTVFGDLPEDGSFVTVQGYLKFRKYTHNGQERVSYDLKANTIEVSEGSSSGPKSQAASAPEKDPWEE